jgi:hypothetical protein
MTHTLTAFIAGLGPLRVAIFESRPKDSVHNVGTIRRYLEKRPVARAA